VTVQHARTGAGPAAALLLYAPSVQAPYKTYPKITIIRAAEVMLAGATGSRSSAQAGGSTKSPGKITQNENEKQRGECQRFQQRGSVKQIQRVAVVFVFGSW